MAYADLYDTQRSTPLRNRFEVAVQSVALGVFAEAAGATNHTERLALAKKVLTSTSESIRYGEMFHRLAVVGDATIQAQGEGATDPQILAAVNTYYTGVAVVGL